MVRMLMRLAVPCFLAALVLALVPKSPGTVVNGAEAAQVFGAGFTQAVWLGQGCNTYCPQGNDYGFTSRWCNTMSNSDYCGYDEGCGSTTYQKAPTCWF